MTCASAATRRGPVRCATAFEAARAIRWTRHLRLFSELDTMSQFMAVKRDVRAPGSGRRGG